MNPGNAGLWHGILIVLMAKVITTLTALSLSAISTNTRVRGGGAYYLISRSLGVEFGAAIGVVFYVAQAASVAMYVIGFTEALGAVLPIAGDNTRLVATVVNVAVMVPVLVGAGWAIKTQYVILGILVVSILAFFLGAASVFDTQTLRENLEPGYAGNDSFFTMFALWIGKTKAVPDASGPAILS